MDNKVTTGQYEDYHENTGRWTLEEHRQFLHAIEIHGKSWKKVASCVKTRSVVQVRTHAQKYFQKIQKNNGTSPLKLADVMNTPSPMIKKIVPLVEPPPLPLLESFHLLSKRTSQESDLSGKFQIPSGPSVDDSPAAVGVVDESLYPPPIKLSIYQENDWFLSHLVNTESPKVVTDGSDSGSDRKSSFDSTEDEEYYDFHAEYFHTPPVSSLH
jgi:SHAQKYF class myb-like DNA-binding protein